MARRSETYDTREERQAAIAAAEAAGEVMLHDELRGDVKTLVFGTTDELPAPADTPAERDWREEYSNAADDAERLGIIAERLGLA